MKPVFFFDQDEIADIERFVKFIANFIMLQNGQTYFKNHAVFTPQDF